MRILLIYPGHSFSTIDVAEGYQTALQALGHTVSAYNYHDMLRFYQGAFTYWHEENEDFCPGADDLLRIASEYVVIRAIEFLPDVVLIVNGMALHRKAFDMLHRINVPLALLLTESPYQDEEQAVILQKGHVALAFTNDRSSVAPLSETGVKVIYLPHSFDPERHKPQRVGTYWHSDVFFHGTLFPERTALFFPLRDLPQKVVISGPAIGSSEDPEALEEELMNNSELAKRYTGAKIALNHHRDTNGKNAWSLGPRAYEIAACGAFQLCDGTRPELVELFGETIPTYEDRDDLVYKIRYYLQHEEERNELARAALNKVQGCTFQARAEQIVVPNLMEVI